MHNMSSHQLSQYYQPYLIDVLQINMYQNITKFLTQPSKFWIWCQVYRK